MRGGAGGSHHAHRGLRVVPAHAGVNRRCSAGLVGSGPCGSTVLTGRANLELSGVEKRLAKRLQTEIEDYFRENPGGKYEFEPASVGAGEFSKRVKNEGIARAR